MQKVSERYGILKSIINSTNTEDLRKGFIETLTHDVKTPILAQIRIIELMLNGHFGEFNREQNEMLKITLDSCKYMYEIISTLISTYKYDCDKTSLRISQFDIMDVCKNALNELKPLLEENNIIFVFNLETISV